MKIRTYHKALIYDGECPLCAAYTNAFVRAGLLAPEQRIAFGELHSQEFLLRMDQSRQGNEIPLVDLDGGETIYGLDALLFLLSQRAPWIGKAFRFRPLYRFLKHLYAMISYNRRVILAKKYATLHCSCEPGFHSGYRWLFIGLATLISVFITAGFGRAVALASGLHIPHAELKMLAICGTGWAVMMFLSALVMKKRAALTYIGNLAVLQLIGVFVLVPAIILAPLMGTAGLVLSLVSVGCSSWLMLRGHIRRVRLMGLSQGWTIAWFGALQLTAAAWLIYFF